MIYISTVYVRDVTSQVILARETFGICYVWLHIMSYSKRHWCSWRIAPKSWRKLEQNELSLLLSLSRIHFYPGVLRSCKEITSVRLSLFAFFEWVWYRVCRSLAYSTHSLVEGMPPVQAVMKLLQLPDIIARLLPGMCSCTNQVATCLLYTSRCV